MPVKELNAIVTNHFNLSINTYKIKEIMAKKFIKWIVVNYYSIINAKLFRVLYLDGKYSVLMTSFEADNYKAIFGGTVVFDRNKSLHN